MRILFISNNKHYDYKSFPRGLIAIIHFWKKSGVKVRTVTKKEQINFYKIYREFSPDLIVGTWIPGATIPVFLKKIGLVKTPIVHLWNDYYSEMMEKYPRSIVGFLEKFTIKNSDYIITVSKFNENRARGFGKEVFYIPHGVNKGLAKTKINLKKLKTSKNNIIFVYIGEQSKYKKVDEIIRAVKGKKCDLFLFGDKNKEFEKIASENVHFMDSVGSEEVNSVLKQADVLVNTSDQDCNFKLFEYINSGKTILAYDGRTNLLLKHKKNAYLTKKFSEGVEDLINNKKLLDEISRNVKKIRTYSWEEIADKHMKIFGKILSILNTLKKQKMSAADFKPE